MQKNLAECCPELIPFSYTLLPCPSRAGVHTKRSPLSKESFLPLEIIRVPWVGSGDPYTFSDTIDEELKMIPPMLPYASEDGRGLNGHAGLVGHR